MNFITIASLVAIILPPILIILAWIINFRMTKDREKLSPFECGFDPIRSARIPFSMRFFLLAVIFIVFDIEIVLLIPAPMILMSSNPFIPYMSISSFILILLIGLLYEWYEGSLDWSN